MNKEQLEKKIREIVENCDYINYIVEEILDNVDAYVKAINSNDTQTQEEINISSLVTSKPLTTKFNHDN